MALLSLIGRLGLDDSDYNAKLGKAEGRANIFAKRFSHSLLHEVTKFATVGFGLGALKGAIDNIKNLEGVSESTRSAVINVGQAFSAMDEVVQEASANLVVLATNFLAVAGAAAKGIIFGGGAGKKHFSDYILLMTGLADLENDRIEAEARIASLGAVLERGKKAAATRLEVAQQVTENKRKPMTNEQQKKALKKEMGLTLEELLTTKAPDKFMEGLSDFEKLRGQLIALTGKTDYKVQSFADKTDPLARIGGFTGGASSKLVVLTEKIEQNTREMANGIENNTVSF